MMINTLKNNPEKRALGCKGYCDKGNQAKRICNINCRKLTGGDKAEKEFRYTPEEIEKIKFIISRYEKYITEKSWNNYLFIAQINKEIKEVLDFKSNEIERGLY